MVFSCKVFDKNGNLKKILKADKIVSEKNNIFFQQKSTKRAVEFIRNLKDPKENSATETKFYDRKCVVCGREFHPRHARSKYCSHECQKKLGLRKKKNKK